MAKIIGCTCSEIQLELVGCDCAFQEAHVMIVEFWPKGYASEEGPKRLKMHEGVDYASEVRKAGYLYASIFSVRATQPLKSKVTAEQAAYYTKGDNT